MTPGQLFGRLSENLVLIFMQSIWSHLASLPCQWLILPNSQQDTSAREQVTPNHPTQGTLIYFGDTYRHLSHSSAQANGQNIRLLASGSFHSFTLIFTQKDQPRRTPRFATDRRQVPWIRSTKFSLDDISSLIK